MWCSPANNFSLSLISPVALHLALLAVQKVRQYLLVCYAGRRGAQRVHNALLGVHADVRLHTEIPLVALARLMHLRVARAGRVLGRRRRVNNGRVHDRARANADAAAVQVMVDRVQHRHAQIVPLQQVAEVQDGRLVRRRRPPKIDSGKPAQRH